METTGKENLRSYELQSVNQALDLIDTLIAARAGQTLSQLSRSSGLSKNKIFRILSTLEQRGMVEKDRYCHYRLGISAFGTAHRILSSQSMLDHARPVMADLAAHLNEAVYLATMVSGEAMFQEMVDCQHAIRTASFVGSRFTLPDAVFAGIASVQFDDEGSLGHVSELNEEVTAVSASLTDESGNVTGALVVLAPAFRITAERLRSEIAPAVGAAAEQLSVMLGSARIRTVPARMQLQSLDNSDKLPVTIPADFRKSVRQCHY